MKTLPSEKTCKKCGETKDVSLFKPVRGNKDGYAGSCKACKKALDAINTARHKAMNELLSMDDIWARTPNRRCCKCKQTLPSTMFDRNNTRKSGLQDQCRECTAVVGAEFRETYVAINSLISIDELRRQTPRSRCHKCKQTLPSTMFDRSNSRKSGLNSTCRECNDAVVKLNRKANPEASRASTARYKAKKLGLYLEDFTYSQIVERDGAEACGYCHTTEGPFDVDHIFPLNLEGWHTPRNLVLACASHNRSKGAVHPAIYIKREGHNPNQTILNALELEHELTRTSLKEEV